VLEKTLLSIAKELDLPCVLTMLNMITLVLLELHVNVVKELNVTLHAPWHVKPVIDLPMPTITAKPDLDHSLENKDISVMP
jgi:hypothetical protein